MILRLYPGSIRWFSCNAKLKRFRQTPDEWMDEWKAILCCSATTVHIALSVVENIYLTSDSTKYQRFNTSHNNSDSKYFRLTTGAYIKCPSAHSGLIFRVGCVSVCLFASKSTLKHAINANEFCDSANERHKIKIIVVNDNIKQWTVARLPTKI